MANETLYDELSSDDEYEAAPLTDEGYDDPSQSMHADDWQTHEDEQSVEAPYRSDDAAINEPLTLDPSTSCPWRSPCAAAP